MQLIDHPWAVCMDRAQKAGQRLAVLLLAGGHGDRPVTLIGHSFGARVLFHCLLELSRCRALGAQHQSALTPGPLSLPAGALPLQGPRCVALVSDQATATGSEQCRGDQIACRTAECCRHLTGLRPSEEMHCGQHLQVRGTVTSMLFGGIGVLVMATP